jgi:hypothetical protein
MLFQRISHDAIPEKADTFFGFSLQQFNEIALIYDEKSDCVDELIYPRSDNEAS